MNPDPTDPGSGASAADHLVSSQHELFQSQYEHGSREFLTSSDPLVQYLVRWRMQTAWRRLVQLVPGLGPDPDVLVLCAGDAGEATTLADLGVRRITVSDLSQNAVDAAVARDPRLTGFASNALDTGLPDRSYDVVVVQDGLHHLPEPVKGFTEQLRLARRAAFFIEGSDSFAGRRFGREWEVEQDATNHVFRWNRRMVDQVAKSYLGRDTFTNASFSFWHHNVYLDRLGHRLGDGDVAVRRVDLLKRLADRVWPDGGNQFCGMVIRRPS